jgi:hypothetical protein
MSSYSKLFFAAFFILIILQLTQLEIKATEPEPIVLNLPDISLGISASFQQHRMDILLPIRFQYFAVVPSVGLVSIGKGSTDLALGLGFRLYQRVAWVSPYIGLKTGLLMYMPKGSDTVTDGVVGLNGGAECFIGSFSIGIEGQLNATLSSKKSARFGNPGNTNLNTAAAIYATIYF